MRLVVFSHKPCWSSPVSPSGYATDGGFPFQMRALAELFETTRLVVPCDDSGPRLGEMSLSGSNLTVVPVSFPPGGTGILRKIGIIVWLIQNASSLFRELRRAHAIHTPIPSDIGTIGLLFALTLRKPLFVRHCGTWGDRSTLTQRFIMWLLPRIAGGRNVVLATGGGSQSPCPDNSAIRWIFSTSISEKEWQQLPLAKPWDGKGPLHLITVSRLDPAKNTAAIIEALSAIRQHYPEACLHVVGDGPAMQKLQRLVVKLNLQQAVLFHGYLAHDAVLKALSQSHIFVFPTRVREGFPKAVLEAMACGLPIVASRVSVIPYLVEPDKGLILEDTSPEAIAQAIFTLASDPQVLAKMGQRARAASNGYTLEAWQNAIGQVLEKAWGPLKRYRHV